MQYDLAQLVDGLKLNRKIAKASPMAEKIRAEMIDTTIPHPPDSDEYLTCVRVATPRPNPSAHPLPPPDDHRRAHGPVQKWVEWAAPVASTCVARP